jgi:hypothetical protein
MKLAVEKLSVENSTLFCAMVGCLFLLTSQFPLACP